MKKWLQKYPKIYAIRYGILISLIVILSVAIDLVTKILTDGKDIEIINGFLDFSSVHNQGAAYGIFSGKSLGLIIVTIVVLIAMIIYNWFHKEKTILYSLGFGLIFGGAIGNLIDRIAFGYVRDFIQFSFFNFTCNVADICLTFGVIIFAIYLIFFDKTFRSKPEQKVEEKTSSEEKHD